MTIHNEVERPSRRDFLHQSAVSLAAAAFPSGVLFGREQDGARGDKGITGAVMSGEIRPGEATVWAKGERASRFFVEYATTPDFRGSQVIEGKKATPENDFTGKAFLRGLPDGQDIFYRAHFRDAPVKSEERIGHFKTPPRESRDVSFIWSGDLCGQGFGLPASLPGLEIFRSMKAAMPDFYIHSGDFIYADHPLKDAVDDEHGKALRQLVTEEKAAVAQTLDQFRGNYRYNLHDPTLRDFFQHVPAIMQWDDHEVLNNWYPGGRTEDPRYQEKSHTRLAEMARRAFLDYTPVSPSASAEMFNSFNYGQLLDVFRIDLRSYRSPNSANTEAAGDECRHILGAKQLSWLKENLFRSKSVWKVIASDMPLGLVVPDGADRFEGVANGRAGAASGREHEIADLLGYIKRMNIQNVVWVTADVHYAAAHYYDPTRAGFQDFNGFWEFVAGPLNAGTFGPNPLDMTFGPRVEFCSVPEGMVQNQPPSKGMQYYGMVSIDAQSKDISVSLHERTGRRLFQRGISPIS